MLDLIFMNRCRCVHRYIVYVYMYLPPFHKLLDIARAYVAEASTVLQLTFHLSLEPTTQHICVHNTEENGLMN